MTGGLGLALDRWGLPRPRDLLHMPKFHIFYLSTRWVDGRPELYDIRTIERRWADMWHDVGVMRYYDSAWDPE